MDNLKNIIDIPKKEPDRWATIKMHLAIRGYTLTKLAKEHGLVLSVITIVKNKSYPNAQKIIADKLLLKPEWIWPERYGTDGKPVSHSPRYPRKGITRNSKRQRTTKKAV